MSIEKILYTATATATGGREGRAASSDQALDVALSTPRELGGAGGAGTNPEQLFAAGYSACFLGALKFVAGQEKVALPADVRVTGKVGIDQTTPGTTNGVVIKDSAGNAIDQTATVNTAADSSVMKLGATSVTPKFAAISSTGSGDTLALVSGKKIRVLSLFLLVAGATTVKFQSGATTDKTGAMSFPANGGISLPFNPIGHFETAAGEKLNHVLGSSVGIAGGFAYIEVP